MIIKWNMSGCFMKDGLIFNVGARNFQFTKKKKQKKKRKKKKKERKVWMHISRYQWIF